MGTARSPVAVSEGTRQYFFALTSPDGMDAFASLDRCDQTPASQWLMAPPNMIERTSFPLTIAFRICCYVSLRWCLLSVALKEGVELH